MTEPLPAGRIVIAGGTGFLGLALARHLTDRGAEVVLISRNEPDRPGPWTHVSWDGRSPGDWIESLEGASALVNLAGRSVDCRKTPDHCDEILRSRVEATRALGRALSSLKKPPPVWVQMSTAHIYGDSLLTCDEDAAIGLGLAPLVGQAWEAEHTKFLLPDMRSVILRTSFVLDQDGGALPRLVRLARWGLAGRLGHGRQGISWIHRRDMNRLFLRAITNPSMSGIYLATAPNPVPSVEFHRELRKVLGMPIGLPATSWMVRIGAPLFLDTDPELALYGRYCVSRRLREEGFEFEFQEVGLALADLFGMPTRERVSA